MKTLVSLISSTRTTAILLILFGLSIALATFVENDFGSDAARSVIYHAAWFDLLLFFGVLNMITVTLRYNMYRREKLPVLLFHLAFIIIIAGAGITRFFGTEGAMHLREGESSDYFLSSDTYLTLEVRTESDTLVFSRPVLFSDIAPNRFERRFRTGKHRIRIRLLKFYEKADRTLRPSEHGSAWAYFVLGENNNRRDVLVKPGTSFSLGECRFNFDLLHQDELRNDQVRVFADPNGALLFRAPFPVLRTRMTDRLTDTLKPFTTHRFVPMSLHYFNGFPLLLRQFSPNSEIVPVQVKDKNARLPSALAMEITVDGITKKLTVFGTRGDEGSPVTGEAGGAAFTLRYGSVRKDLPFSIMLHDFLLKRYPGSGSPSWFESRVDLIDHSKEVKRPQRIYMNNILHYRGYRFYQSSYDADEHGSILSVNHDGAGTFVTYLGYLCLAAGIFLTLTGRNSRFAWLWKNVSRSNIKGYMLAAVLTLSAGSFSLNVAANDLLPGTEGRMEDGEIARNHLPGHPNTLPDINPELAKIFDTVLVQDNSGRIIPMNTLASEVLRKVARKESYKGQLPCQVILGMLAYPGIWLQEPMIRIAHPGLAEKLGAEGGYASFTDFFTSGGMYRLRPDVEQAYRKKPAYRTKYDNEVIRADERLNICNMIYSKSALKLFPVPGDTSGTWYSPVTAQGAFTTSDSVFAKFVIDYLAMEIQKSDSGGNWSAPAQLARTIGRYQQNHGGVVLPSESHVAAEIFYNKADLFTLVMRMYLFTGFLLLLIQFIHIFYPRFRLKYFSVPAFIIILAAFLGHMTGLVLRWYIAGHAPWSNGYEALIFIAWATVLAGLIFYRKSGVALSATAILAALILMVARLSWMDPQITNLVPVLKSYWLVIHVAVITSSYGFLGLGALLAAFNLLLMVFQSPENTRKVLPSIDQITMIIEMTLIIGLFLLTTGTFLGGVWANESWGRYWGWDPKETWALTTAIVYAVILHLRLIPGLKGKVLFNILALTGFASVVMTYFGVNYYLSGLHSYAKGDPLPVPPQVYASAGAVLLLCMLAVINQKNLRRKNSLRRPE